MVKKLTKEEMDFLNENPAGKIEDLPDVLKERIKSTFNVAKEIIKERKESGNKSSSL